MQGNKMIAHDRKSWSAKAFIAILHKKTSFHYFLQRRSLFGKEEDAYVGRSADGQIEFAVCLRPRRFSSPFVFESSASNYFVLGDDTELTSGLPNGSIAAGVPIEFNPVDNKLQLFTSIVGLPPIFVLQSNDITAIFSDFSLLNKLNDISLHFDPRGVADFSRIGHPIEGRTLFKEVQTVPAGHLVEIYGSGVTQFANLWSLPESEPFTDWDSYTDAQVFTFREILKQIDYRDSFLSLTAGIDTRAVLAGTIELEKKLPAFTLSGRTLSLDAKIALSLCRSYRLPHESILLDNGFLKVLPECISQAALLSGGLASISQAHEVFFYNQIGGKYFSRLCGNLGNQVGRRGVEGVSMRNTDSSILSRGLIDPELREDHWYSKQKSPDGLLDFAFLLEHEIPSSSLANYCIGNYFKIQKSPYAHFRLIETAARQPRLRNDETRAPSILRMRLMDLKHRFLGENEKRSFQVKLIKQVGGAVASHPINWGWKAKGGVSPWGMVIGVGALIDVVSIRHGLDEGKSRRLFDFLGITGLHEYRTEKYWVKNYLPEFIMDTLSSITVKKSGLFESRRLNYRISEYFSGNLNSCKEVIFALDLSLAAVLFKATV
jgi:hypothetical protein